MSGCALFPWKSGWVDLVCAWLCNNLGKERRGITSKALDDSWDQPDSYTLFTKSWKQAAPEYLCVLSGWIEKPQSQACLLYWNTRTRNFIVGVKSQLRFEHITGWWCTECHSSCTFYKAIPQHKFVDMTTFMYLFFLNQEIITVTTYQSSISWEKSFSQSRMATVMVEPVTFR